MVSRALSLRFLFWLIFLWGWAVNCLPFSPLTNSQVPSHLRSTVLGQSTSSYHINDFLIEINNQNNEIIISKNDKLIFQTYSSAFIRYGNATVKNPPIVNGNYQLQEEILWISSQQSINNIVMDNENLKLTISGQLFSSTLNDNESEEASIPSPSTVPQVDYTLIFFLSTESDNQLSFILSIPTPSLSNEYNRLFLLYTTSAEETFHGFGESFTNFNLKGRRVPILVSEQGVGRGLQPITDDLNNGTEGVGGHWYTTYAPKPLYLTNQNKSLVYDNSEVFLSI